MAADGDLLAFRRGYYHVLAGLFVREPSVEFLASLRTGLARRVEAANALHPSLGEGWVVLSGWLDGDLEMLREAAEDEFTRLFIGPYTTELHPYESYYLTGKTFDRPLAAVRAFLREAGLEKDSAYAEPEDSLAFELEVMWRLVNRQAEATSSEAADRSATLQAAFLRQHLLVWAPAFVRDLVDTTTARFYRGAGLVLGGFLALELDLVKDQDPEGPRSLEAARQAYLGSSPWRGPLFDAETGRTEGPGISI